jgi:hypothetical protein
MIRKAIMRYMVASGVDVYYNVGKKRHTMTPAYKRFFDREWVGKYLQEQELGFDAVGFVVVRFITSKVDGELVPHCLDPSQYHAYFYYDEEGKRQWQIFNARPQVNSYTGKRTRSAAPVGVGSPMEDVVVFEREDEGPLFNGELASNVAVVAERVSSIEQKYQNQDYSDYWRAHAPWVTQSAPGKLGQSPLESNDLFGEDDVAEVTGSRARHIQREGLDLMETALSHAEDSSRRRNTKEIGTVYDTASRFGANPHSANPPYLQNFPMPDGYALAQTQRPELLPQLAETVDHQMAQIYNVFGVPPSMGIQTRAAFEAHVKDSRKQFNMTVVQRQQHAQTILEELYGMVYRNSHEEFIDEIVSKKEEKLRAKKRKTDTAPPPAEEGGATEEVEDLGPGEPRKEMDLSLFEQEKLRSLVEMRTYIVVAFRHMPDTELPEVDYLWKNGFISRDTAADATISVVGLGSDKKLEEKEGDQELDKQDARTLSRQEAASKANPPAAAAGGHGSSSVPEKKKKSKTKDGDKD